MPRRDTRDTIRFAGSVSGGDSETERHQVDTPSRIEQVNVRIYRGAELSLHVLPFIEFGTDPDRRERLPVVTFAGEKQYVDGDDDAWEFPVEIPIDDDELIGVEITNTSADHSYDYSVDFELERLEGSW